MKYYIVAETRESYPSLIASDHIYNDYISLKSIKTFVNTLVSLGYDCMHIGGTKELFNIYKKNIGYKDIIFINYNYGLPAQYKRVQGPALLELMQAKYSGAAPFSALLVNDKLYSKKVLKDINILSSKGYLLMEKEDINCFIVTEKLNLPVVLKPNMEGSSLGINDDSLCYTYETAKQKAFDLLKNFPQVIVEEYIPGYECTVWIIGNKNNFQFIKPLLISVNHKFYFENKIFTMDDKANHIKNYSLPDDILPSNTVKKINDLSIKIFLELELRDYARIDFRIYKNDIYFIEANALPVFSKTSEIGEISKLYNMTYEEICTIFIQVINSRLMC